ncbi:hypothetical protein HMPREF1553_00229 [Porphyromonas gingivalis F0568]|nr:hypothetical protein HMPREF1553_00229 [Porphyromonas gingivalis F0568]
MRIYIGPNIQGKVNSPFFAFLGPKTSQESRDSIYFCALFEQKYSL